MTTDNVTYVLRHLRKLAATPAAGDLTDGDLLERFCRGREETAFALLVQRHGPMVLSVCRRIVHDAHDAEAAFQAAFLVLARKAGDVRKQASLASFLYGVARRVATQARARAARRRARQRELVEMSRPESCDELTWQELHSVLDDELSRLPNPTGAATIGNAGGLPAALALIKDLKDPMEHDRHHGNIAHKLAGSKPAEAERVLGMLGKPGRVS